MATKTSQKPTLPPPIVVDCRGSGLDELLTKEWLVSNRIGAYASSTVLGCNVRRYHGLLVAATTPPVGRIVTLSTVIEQVIVGEHTFDLATNEFPDTFSPRGMAHLVEFRNEAAATFVYEFAGMQLVKRVILADRKNAAAVQYTLRGGSARIVLRPMAAMRDFHHLRQAGPQPQMTFEQAAGGVIVQDRQGPNHTLCLSSKEAVFRPDPQWWYHLRYRIDLARGQDGSEDLYSPGSFELELRDGQPVQLNASLDEPVACGFDTTSRGRAERMEQLAASVGDKADETARRLAVASDAFVVQRSFPSAASAATIVAGYHWFADWGRDAFIALPGLLLSTRRLELAEQVFSTFAGSLADGMIPNRFDDYAPGAHYNSIDASLWFILAAERYLTAGGRAEFWRDVLMPAADAILTAYRNGTRFDIHADADGLLTGGSHQTQLTWMDAKLGEEVITPRHGKAVEINALWYFAHRMMAERCRGLNGAAADRYAHHAELIGQAFAPAFWNDGAGCLYDCVHDGSPDASIRPNQLFAVSLPHTPLSEAQQRGVMNVLTDKLLTPLGLRTLAPDDSRYRRGYGSSWESRDRAYHQGTVWAWLIGPYIEAHLRLDGDKPYGVARAKDLLAAFDGHLAQGGLGQVSEIFDGDAPHAPRGCIAQAWSVAEVLRAKQLIAEYDRRQDK